MSRRTLLVAGALFMLAAAIVAFTLYTIMGANRPLSQDQYVEQTQAAGFTVLDPAKAYNMAKLLCAGKDDADFESSTESLTRLATVEHPKTEDQIKRYIEIVRSVC